MSNVIDPTREEVFYIAGDVGDPLDPSKRGIAATTRLDTSAKHIQVRYKDFLLECDYYEMEGVAPAKLVLICPKCHHVLNVPGDKKKIEYDPTSLQVFGGRLSVEAFQCTWETEPEGQRREFGLGLCKQRLAIEDNVAKDA
jgi:hypothetical protein